MQNRKTSISPIAGLSKGNQICVFLPTNSPYAQCSTSVLYRKMITEIGSGNDLLNIARNVLAIGNIVQVQGLRCTSHGVHLHLICHICVSDDCLSFQHFDKFRPWGQFLAWSVNLQYQIGLGTAATRQHRQLRASTAQNHWERGPLWQHIFLQCNHNPVDQQIYTISTKEASLAAQRQSDHETA